MEYTNHGSVHPVELSIYSLLSTDLDGIYQSINELRESQAILVLKLRGIRDSLKRESSLLYESEDLREANAKLVSLNQRAYALTERFKAIHEKSKKLNS